MKGPRSSHDDRNAGWAIRYAYDGVSFEELGAEAGVTRQRVQQIISEKFPWAIERRKRLRKERETAPRICRACGAPYEFREWRSHQKATGCGRAPRQFIERNRQIVADYLKGMRNVDIQAKYRIKATGIYQALGQFGLQPNRRPSNRMPTAAESRARQLSIIRDLDAGIRVKDIVEKYRVSDSYVTLIRRQRDVILTREYNAPLTHMRSVSSEPSDRLGEPHP